MSDPKTFLVVGGATGIGAAVVRHQQSLGNELIVTSRDPDKINSGNGITVQAYDVTQHPDQKLDLPETLDGVVYCPGTITLKAFHRMTRADFERDMEINLYGAVEVIQRALPALKRAPGASIVLFSSIAASTGLGFHASIAAAKGAVEGFGRSLAAELAPRTRVNVIAPSLTDTPLASSLLSSPQKRDASAARHPLQTLGDPHDVAELVSFLLGPSSTFMTGQVLRPDGGLSSVRLF